MTEGWYWMQGAPFFEDGEWGVIRLLDRGGLRAYLGEESVPLTPEQTEQLRGPLLEPDA